MLRPWHGLLMLEIQDFLYLRYGNIQYIKFNAAMMYWEGGDKIKINKKAALVWFEKIQKSGMIDVSS